MFKLLHSLQKISLHFVLILLLLQHFKWSKRHVLFNVFRFSFSLVNCCCRWTGLWWLIYCWWVWMMHLGRKTVTGQFHRLLFATLPSSTLSHQPGGHQLRLSRLQSVISSGMLGVLIFWEWWEIVSRVPFCRTVSLAVCVTMRTHVLLAGRSRML